MEMQVLVEGKVLFTRKEKSSVLRGLDFAKFRQVQEEPDTHTHRSSNCREFLLYFVSILSPEEYMFVRC